MVAQSLQGGCRGRSLPLPSWVYSRSDPPRVGERLAKTIHRPKARIHSPSSPEGLLILVVEVSSYEFQSQGFFGELYSTGFCECHRMVFLVNSNVKAPSS